MLLKSPSGLFFYLNKNKKMKTYKEFCRDANIRENWFNDASKVVSGTVRNVTNTIGITKPKPQQVLAYKNYSPGVLNKTTGQFTQRAHSKPEQERYGWKPVNVSSYSKKDTPGPKTASGHNFDDRQRLVAVPYKYKKGQAPKGTWKGTPSTPFGTKLNVTAKPMGTSTKVSNTSVQDTGDFGPAGDYNKSTSYDLALQTARDVTGNSNITSTEFGKRKVYVRPSPKP